ncbi:MAG: (4Fe-4S)-binding protein [Chloroflexi bacterium]|nr:(4Fe-4S)-binding protein [Chloroflexota bacterium]
MSQPHEGADERVLPYTNGEIVVYWKPGRCIHSARCVAGLPAVFDPQRRPWIRLDKAETEAVVATVERCPSGALSWRAVGLAAEGARPDRPEAALEIQPLPDGPLLVTGAVRLVDEAGESQVLTRTTLCRCGASGRKPFCDGSHVRVGFRTRADDDPDDEAGG